MKCCMTTKATAELKEKVSEELSIKDPTNCCLAAIINKGEKDETASDDGKRENKDSE